MRTRLQVTLQAIVSCWVIWVRQGRGTVAQQADNLLVDCIHRGHVGPTTGVEVLGCVRCSWLFRPFLDIFICLFNIQTIPFIIKQRRQQETNFTKMIQNTKMPSVLWRCWLGGRKVIRPVKTEWWGTGVVICLERGADLHMTQLMPLPLTVSCFSEILIGFTFLVPAHLGSPRKRAVKRVYVCDTK